LRSEKYRGFLFNDDILCKKEDQLLVAAGVIMPYSSPSRSLHIWHLDIRFFVTYFMGGGVRRLSVDFALCSDKN